MLENRYTRLVSGTLVIAAGLLILLNNVQSDANLVSWLWIALLAASTLSYGYIYAHTRDTAAAFGGYIAGALALLLISTQFSIAGLSVPVLVMALIGAPFLFFGLRSEKNRALLIPAYVMFALALMLLLTEHSAGAFNPYVPSYVMAAIGLPFVAATLISRTWALLIPGGIVFAMSWFLMTGFSGFSGFSIQVLTIGVPLLLIVIGALILLRPGNDMRKARHH
jgi:hypothetical protein